MRLLMLSMLLVSASAFGQNTYLPVPSRPGAGANSPLEVPMTIVLAQQWSETFNRLDPRASIRVGVLTGDSVTEFNRVFELEGRGHLVRLKFRSANGREYDAYVRGDLVAYVSEGD